MKTQTTKRRDTRLAKDRPVKDLPPRNARVVRGGTLAQSCCTGKHYPAATITT
jgi:hypothetical protein